MKTKYTVAEYAELKGISAQAVYKQIKKNKLVGRVVIENDTTYILEADNQPLNHTQPTIKPNSTNQDNHDLPLRGNDPSQPTTDNQPLNHTQPKDNQPLNHAHESDHLNRIIDILENQLKEKDKQIAEKDKQILALTERLSENNFIQAQDKKIKMIESETSGATKNKKHRGIFARFKKERLYPTESE